MTFEIGDVFFRPIVQETEIGYIQVSDRFPALSGNIYLDQLQCDGGFMLEFFLNGQIFLSCVSGIDKDDTQKKRQDQRKCEFPEELFIFHVDRVKNELYPAREVMSISTGGRCRASFLET
jgi:hypothetical protein